MILCPWSQIDRYYDLLPGLKKAVETINACETLEVGTYPLPAGRYMVQHITTAPAEGALFEAHRNFADVQYILRGGEDMTWAPLNTLTPAKPYNPTKDKEMLSGEGVTMHVPEGMAYIVFPEDAHSPGLSVGECHEVEKIVVKLPCK